MKFQAPESLSEQIAQHVGRRIIQGQLRPGERIQELKVVSELDVSRGSVREALLILERRHLIRIYPRKGAVVSALTPAMVDALYDMYAVLLTMLCERLAERWTDEGLKQVLAQVAQVQAAVARGAPADDIIQAGFGVMGVGYALVGNPYLEETLENLRPAISRTYHLSIRHSAASATVHTQHFFEALVAAVVARDKGRIGQTIQAFAAQQRETVLAALAPH